MRVLACGLLALAGALSAQQAPAPPPYVPPPAPQLSQDRAAALVARTAASGSDTAVTPLQVQAPDPAFVGKLLLTRHPINPPPIATQGLLPLGAVRVMTAKGERILPLSIVGRVAAGGGVPSDPKRRAYCNAKEERGDAIRCYQDTDGDGRFDVARWGQTYSDDSPYTLYMVMRAEPLPAPLPYVAASPADLPALRLIYQGCRVTDRIQYAARIGVQGDGDVKTFGCPSAAQPIGRSALVGPGRYRVDRVTVDIAYATPEEATATLVAGIPAGTVLDRIDVGKPLRLLGERKGWPVEQAELRLRYATPPYRFVGIPVLTAQGTAGTALLSGPYRYGYTARIVGDAAKSTMFSGKKPAFADGDALYGIPMQNPLVQQQFGEPMMMWCAPKEKKPGDWRANCLQQQEVTRGVYDGVYGALWIEAIPAAASNSDAIEVAEGPADLPQPDVRYEFSKWTNNRLILRAHVGLNGADVTGWRQVDVPRLKDGSALLGIAGGVIHVTPTADLLGFRAAAMRPLAPDASAQPRAGLIAQMLDTATDNGRPLTTEEKARLLDEGEAVP
ncbi:MAG: hypothetical protein V4537_06525 [Pseudomonadota bacterium]